MSQIASADTPSKSESQIERTTTEESSASLVAAAASFILTHSESESAVPSTGIDGPYGFIPPAPTRFPVHAQWTLKPTEASHLTESGSTTTPSQPPSYRGRLLIVGDIHGCFDELMTLLDEVKFQQGIDQVLCVGDLVSKGPKSEEVVTFLRTQGFFSVVGNHETGLLSCAMYVGRFGRELSEVKTDISEWDHNKVKDVGGHTSDEYARTFYARIRPRPSDQLQRSSHYQLSQEMSVENLEWLSQLPTTIDLRPTFPIIVMHGGVIPGLPIAMQSPQDITNLRNFQPNHQHQTERLNDTPNVGSKRKGDEKQEAGLNPEPSATSAPKPTASPGQPSRDGDIGSAWSLFLDDSYGRDGCSGPSVCHPLVVFGHDARRGFQHPNRFRLGIDTGCCFGRQLTALVLQMEGDERQRHDWTRWRIVTVKAKQQYATVNEKGIASYPPPANGTMLGNVPCQLPSMPHALRS